MKKLINRIQGQMRYATQLLKFVGPKAFFEQLGRQIYSNHVQIGVRKDFEDITRVEGESPTKYYFRLATEKDMEDVFSKIKGESKENAKLLLERKWLYDSGLRKWYVARTVEDDDPCFIQGVVHPEENDYMDKHLKGWFPILRDDEILLEGAYAFQKYRGGKLCHMIATDIWMMYKEKGYKRMITYIKSNNEASLRASAKTGFVRFEEFPVRKFMFFTKRKLLGSNGQFEAAPGNAELEKAAVK